MKQKVPVVFTLLVVAAAACTGSDQYLQFAPNTDVEDFVEAATGGRHIWTHEALVARLGEPVAVDQQGDQRTVRYYGLALHLSRDTLTTIMYTDSRFTAPGGVRVGYTTSRVRSQWGPPLRDEGDTWAYQTEGGYLVLTITDDAVAQVEWHLERGR